LPNLPPLSVSETEVLTVKEVKQILYRFLVLSSELDTPPATSGATPPAIQGGSSISHKPVQECSMPLSVSETEVLTVKEVKQILYRFLVS
jgi:hypothetical protein